LSGRVVVSIEPGMNGMTALKMERMPPPPAPGMRDPVQFTCDPGEMPPWHHPGALQAHGSRIKQALAAHPVVQQVLAQVSALAKFESRPLYFKLLTPEAEQLRWEAISDDAGTYFALNRRSPIGRIADSGVSDDNPPRAFTPPLRLMTLLSVLGHTAREEWTALRSAVEEARQQGLPVQVSLLVGEEELFDGITAEIQAGTLRDVSVRMLPDRTHEVEDLITRFSPHLLHFFCHGSAGYGNSQLELATLRDREQAADRSSLILRIDQLVSIDALRGCWLVTLNCCEGGTAAEGLHSMAYRLVESGISAAIGMQEPIEVGDASEFTHAFYPEVFRVIRERLGQVQINAPVEIEWAETLVPPRNSLRDRHNQEPNHRAWTLPTLYVRPEAFQLLRGGMLAGVGPAALEGMKRRAEIVAGLLRSLPPETPEEHRRQFLSVLDDIPEVLRPRLDGTFAAQVT
jgi:hypothetical protein